MNYEVAAIQGAKGVQSMSSASMATPLYSKLSNTFSAMDAGQTGSVSASQFMNSFSSSNPPAKFAAAGAQAIWNQLDPSGTGSVSRQAFVQGLAKLSASMRPDGSIATPTTTAATAPTSGLNLSV